MNSVLETEKRESGNYTSMSLRIAPPQRPKKLPQGNLGRGIFNYLNTSSIIITNIQQNWSSRNNFLEAILNKSGQLILETLDSLKSVGPSALHANSGLRPSSAFFSFAPGWGRNVVN